MTQGFSKEPGPEPQLNPTAWPVVWPSQLAGSLRLLEFQASVHQGYIFGCSIRVSAVSPFESFRICPTPSTEDFIANHPLQAECNVSECRSAGSENVLCAVQVVPISRELLPDQAGLQPRTYQTWSPETRRNRTLCRTNPNRSK